MPTIDRPILDFILGALMLLLGSGAGGFIVALRKDRRLEKRDDASILNEVRKIAREEVAYVARQLRTERQHTERLEGRIEQLTEVLRAAGLHIPRWHPTLSADTANAEDRT